MELLFDAIMGTLRVESAIGGLVEKHPDVLISLMVIVTIVVLTVLWACDHLKKKFTHNDAQ